MKKDFFLLWKNFLPLSKVSGEWTVTIKQKADNACLNQM